MVARLKQIEIENFKSFRGKEIIGPFNPFTAVIGPNGSGKSNFMDAISFVLGEGTRVLRVHRLSDLVHGAIINKPVSQRASVTVVFVLEDQTEISFQRSIRGSSSEYVINNNVVSAQDYLAEMQKLNINVKGKNTLVFQGEIESIATKKPKELTALFDEISGSGALKAEYDRLKFEKEKGEQDRLCASQKVGLIKAEIKEATLEDKEADKYRKLKDNLDKELIKHQLFKLFHCVQEIESFAGELLAKFQEVEELEVKKRKAEEFLKETKKELGECERELAKNKQNIRESEVGLFNKKSQSIQAKERVSHLQNKLNKAIKTLEQAKNTHDAHYNDIRKLEEELRKVELANEEYEATVAQNRGNDVELAGQQEKEYIRLKGDATKRSLKYKDEFDSINKEQQADQDRLDNIIRLRTDAENRHRHKARLIEQMENKMVKLEEYIRESKQMLSENERLRDALKTEVDITNGRVLEIQKQLDDISAQLGDASFDRYEEERQKKKRQTLENFKTIFAGVYDRLINLCEPIDRRYNVAITKVFGKYMDAIVVDSQQTALRCILYLKQQMLEPETFLPLRDLQCHALKENLRSITEPKGVKLVYDVLKFEPAAIEKAVLFATDNALVCETIEDAQQLSRDVDFRYRVVALDGTCYSKTSISGGLLDLAKKAKRWDQKQVFDLKAQKDKLTEELREAMKRSRKNVELNRVESEIRDLNTRLRYVKDMRDTANQMKHIEKELTRLGDEIAEFDMHIAEIERSMQIRERDMERIKATIDRIQDDVFSQFCRDIGVDNIRQYEAAQIEQKQNRLELQNQMDRIKNNLEYERSCDTQSKVTRWEKTVRDERERLEECKEEERNHQESIDQDVSQIEQLRAENMRWKQELNRIKGDLVKARSKFSTIVEDVQATRRQISSLEANIEKKRSERHDIFVQCKIEDIAIPMSVSMEDILSEPASSTNADTISTEGQYEREARIEIDYSLLSADLKLLQGKEQLRKISDQLLGSIKTLQDNLGEIPVPNLNAHHKLEQAQENLKCIEGELKSLRKLNRRVEKEFEAIKMQRRERFLACFDHVANQIDTMYKQLTQNESAQAILSADNADEPYLDEVDYSCCPPGKRFQLMADISGGEKTMAALALLFAIQSYQSAPFFVLDEIDAALDIPNMEKVANFVNRKKASLRIIAISLNPRFYCHADALIGICPAPEVDECLISQVVRIDLSGY